MVAGGIERTHSLSFEGIANDTTAGREEIDRL
jgi:hypothetical protein